MSESSSSSTSYSFTLQREAMEEALVGQQQSYRMQITCTDAGDLDTRIFLYQQLVFDPDDENAKQERFIAVCSPADMVEYPPDEPDPERIPLFFRLATIDVASRNLATLEEFWTILQEDVQGLANALQAMDNLTTVETTTIESDS